MSAVKRKHEEAKQYTILTKWMLYASDVREKKVIQDAAKPVPNLPNVSYHFQFHPKLLENPHITLSLEMLTNMNIIADIKVQVVYPRIKTIKKWTQICTKSDEYCSKLCSYDELFEKVFTDANCYTFKIKATLIISDVNDVFTKKPKVDNLGLTLWKNENGKDAKIIVDGKEIKVHKCVLQSRSTILNGLIEAEIKPEPGKRASNTLNDAVGINNYKFEIAEKAVMFCYDLLSFDKVSAEDAIDLFKFADEFGIDDLKKMTEDYCREILDVSNAVLFANSSITIKTERLYQKSLSFLLKCMKDGTTVKDIEKLDAEMKDGLFVKAFNKKA